MPAGWDQLSACLLQDCQAQLRAQRVLVVREGTRCRSTAANALPAGEKPAALLKAIAPWLDEARASGEPRLRHGPPDGPRSGQRSCIVVPLRSDGRLRGYLYADVDGHVGRCTARHLATAKSIAARALRTHSRASERESASEIAALREELSQARAQQEAMAAVLQVISLSVEDPQPVVAARLESHTKVIGCWLAVDGATRTAVGERIALQSFGEIALKGKSAATQVHGISRS